MLARKQRRQRVQELAWRPGVTNCPPSSSVLVSRAKASQIFRPRANTIARVLVYGGIPLLLAAIGWSIAAARSPWITGEHRAAAQPVPFSHEHHVGGLGIDCRYCHTSVESSAFAGLPPTETCMTCHSQLWRSADMLEPVRASYRTGRPLEWERVNDLPDFVYFDHSIHVHRGVACTTCHGRVDQMPLMRQAHSLLMQWCLDCHRNPQHHTGALNVFEPTASSAWARGVRPRPTPDSRGDPLPRLLECSICHR